MTFNTKRILIETDVLETYSIRIGHGHTRRDFCDACGIENESIDLNAAVTASGIPAAELIRRIEFKLLHSPQSPTGHLLICLDSLKKQPELSNRNYEIDID